MLCINSAILLPWVQLSVQQKYDLPKNEKYCVLGGKKSDATRKSWKLFSNPLTVRGWRGGEGCSLPVAHQSGRSTILNISGNSLDLFVNVLRVFLILTVHWGRRSAPHLWEGLDRPHCIYPNIWISAFQIYEYQIHLDISMDILAFCCSNSRGFSLWSFYKL